MKSVLVIDRGNSTLKAYLFQGYDCVRSARFEEDDDIAAGISTFLGDETPASAIYASTGCRTEGDIETISGLPGCRTLIFDRATPLPIAIDYATPDTLGLDRIASAVAACALLDTLPGLDFLLVVDAGTAVTLDIAAREGGFRGGNISAGLSMRLHALHDFTSALPLTDVNGDCPDFGFDTRSALRSGAILGIAAEIESSFQKAARKFGKGAILLTGGDAAILATHLDPSLRVITNPALVADGLNRILHYNETTHKAI